MQTSYRSLWWPAAESSFILLLLLAETLKLLLTVRLAEEESQLSCDVGGLEGRDLLKGTMNIRNAQVYCLDRPGRSATSVRVSF